RFRPFDVNPLVPRRDLDSQGLSDLLKMLVARAEQREQRLGVDDRDICFRHQAERRRIDPLRRHVPCENSSTTIVSYTSTMPGKTRTGCLQCATILSTTVYGFLPTPDAARQTFHKAPRPGHRRAETRFS